MNGVPVGDGPLETATNRFRDPNRQLPHGATQQFISRLLPIGWQQLLCSILADVLRQK